ncbi:hypothetical protein CHLNCDRAFT_138360 [Chlorella variabilis]|uniref:Uncharacterized protein n=1 Tax=Chlorella variabilis TaxID=554065 RepID=E1ZMV7_CHLVA|nr:hypothetical protein CHLNCDRAFT_138360 [Chlorella variabilis]EFN52868.1 hypothetical protein CHLNCDRAFT_138360 [Chlorella variabilis]|eukprot:XP_005844970.1 hypothetical protein CHLNCDRAFT_138360 [Chlorella variabilis]
MDGVPSPGVLWKVVDDDSQQTWWGALIINRNFTQTDSFGRPVYILKYDAWPEMGFGEDMSQVSFVSQNVLLDLGSGTELDWRVPQVVMPMAPAAPMAAAPMAAPPQQAAPAMAHAPPPAPQYGWRDRRGRGGATVEPQQQQQQ